MPFWWTWSLDGELVVVAGLLLHVDHRRGFGVAGIEREPSRSERSAQGRRACGAWARDGPHLTCARDRSGRADLGRDARRQRRGADRGAHRELRLGHGHRESVHDGYRVARGALRNASRQRSSFYDRLLAELRTTPGIDAAARHAGIGPRAVCRSKAPSTRLSATVPTAWIVVLSESPAPIGPTLIAGRTFDSGDDATGVKTALVSRTLASRAVARPSRRSAKPSTSRSATRQRSSASSSASSATLRSTRPAWAPRATRPVYVPLPQRILPASRVDRPPLRRGSGGAQRHVRGARAHRSDDSAEYPTL